MLSDIEIAQSIKLKPIWEIAEKAGIQRDELELHGDDKAKVKLEILERLKDRPNGKYVDVTAITPTPLGEGKTVTTIALSLGLNRIGKKIITCIRQPSLGPVFGIKGGAAGGGYSQVLPMEDFNLHLTGDVHAVSIAHNLAAAFLDNHLQKGNKLKIDPAAINWRRVVDLNDRWALERVVIGLGEGFVRESGFDISVASELMAILALASDLADLRKRVGRVILAYTYDGKPVTTEDLKCAGSMTVLLKDAIKPNLLQTIEYTPVFVHAGPFANIAHGNSSIVADKIALKLVGPDGFVVTESGFGADMGMEKFFNIKCRASGLIPSCVVLVASIRALKMHSGRPYQVAPGQPLDERLTKEDLGALSEGMCNLEKHVENVRLFGIPVVVAINRFSTDTEAEMKLVAEGAKKAGAAAAVINEGWAKGGAGATELAKAVVEACNLKSEFRFLYPDDMPLEEKIRTIATKVYGAKDIELEPLAKKKLKQFTKGGYGNLPICMAKTHLSLSHDPTLKGRPRDFILPVRDVRISAGAGFIYPLCGAMRTIPGLPSHPAGEAVDIDANGRIVGLF